MKNVILAALILVGLTACNPEEDKKFTQYGLKNPEMIGETPFNQKVYRSVVKYDGSEHYVYFVGGSVSDNYTKTVGKTITSHTNVTIPLASDSVVETKVPQPPTNHVQMINKEEIAEKKRLLQAEMAYLEALSR